MDAPNLNLSSSSTSQANQSNQSYVGGDIPVDTQHHAANSDTSLLMTANGGAEGSAQQVQLYHQYHNHDDHDEDGGGDHEEEYDDYDVTSSVTSHAINKDTAAIIRDAVQPMDIVCGRGSRVAHPGNQRFRKIILERKQEYQKAQRRDEKTRITHEIVEILRSGPEPSRFLLKDTRTNEWYDVGIEYAREKVSHALRSRPNEERRKRSIQQPKNKRIQRGGNHDSAATSSSPCSSTGDKSTNGSSLELEETVKSLIHDQQQLLKSMIQKESFPVYS